MTRFRGWQRTALVALATVAAVIAAMVAIAATQSPWRTAKVGSDHLWLAVTLAVLAVVAVPLLFRYSRRRGRTSRLVGGGVIAVGLLGVVAVLVLAPDTNPAIGVGWRVPLVFASAVLLIVAGAAALAASLSAEPAGAQWLPAIAVPVVLVLLMVFAVEPGGRAYLLDTNESLSGPRGPVESNPRSELTGETAWSSRSFGYTSDGFRNAISTPSGIATARTTGAVEMLDPVTGVLRWRYSRSDATGVPDLSLIDGGRLLLAEFDGVGYLVLDAATGARKSAWPYGTRDHDIQNADPLLTGETVGKGSDKLRGVDADGNDRWTFEPGRCTTISATATADTALVFLNRSCGKANEVLALDVHSGRKLWDHGSEWLRDSLVSGGLFVGLRSSKELAAVEARTGDVKWHRDLPSGLGCDTQIEQAGAQIVVLNCPAGKDKIQTVVTVINAADGSVAWQQTGSLNRERPAVTADARVASLMRATNGSCELHVIEQSGYRKAVVPEDVRCNLGVRAVGNTVIARGEDTIIGLR
ncbi:PQQ-binding-like beta-propeller repeat protein [Kribbella sp. NPDC005582]|uniref:outer membrane protein assembly factor BamB family protein n=1 Tax=Kribbella sp. NPDC005582 TaxID=3156893 RepID=UPI0033ADD76E